MQNMKAGTFSETLTKRSTDTETGVTRLVAAAQSERLFELGISSVKI